MFNAHCFTKIIDVDGIGRITLERLSGSRMILVAGHASSRVVQDNNCAGGLIVDHVHQGIDTGMEEGGIADERNPVFHVVLAFGLFHAVERRDAGAHADIEIQDFQRCYSTQCVATDIAGTVKFQLFQNGKYAAVRTSGAENRGTPRCLGRCVRFYFFMQNGFPQHIGAVLALNGEDFFAHNRNSPGADLFFHNRFQFFNNIKRFHLLCELFNQLSGKGMYQPQFQDRGIRQCFPDILIRNSAGDYANFAVTVFCPVDIKVTGIFGHLLETLFHNNMPLPGICRHQDILFNISDIRLIRHFNPFFRMNHALGMGQSGCGTHNDRRIIGFAVCKRKLCENPCFFAVRRFQNRHHGCTCYHPGVLFILRTIDPRIISCNQNQAAVYAGIGDGIQRIGCNIDTDQLHGSHSASTGNRCTDCHFHGNLFIRRPFCINFRIFCNTFTDFSTWRTRISGRDFYACFISALCNGRISEHNFGIVQQIPFFRFNSDRNTTPAVGAVLHLHIIIHLEQNHKVFCKFCIMRTFLTCIN